MSSLKEELYLEVEQYSLVMRETILEYLSQLNEKEYIAYKIAKDHLGTSFHILKSIGFMEWKKNQKLKEKESS
uniref:Uncharacterized protein n=1 Tax=viral metagenome TaxID=1070528 RepID=A0A6C0B182_9ZZZZ